MDPQRWPRVRALYAELREATPEAREARLSELDDIELARLTREMLRAQARADTVLDRTVEHEFDALPERIGDYRPIRLLGRGGMGVVYLAEQSVPRRRVAIKVIGGARSAQAIARLRREADALARLSHPGITQIHDVGVTEDGAPFLVMEYVEGEELGRHVAKLDIRARLLLMTRIGDAIDHAHAQRVVHRDLKPTNILVDIDGRPKILDFGIASLGDIEGEPLTATGMLLGTPAYLSPEAAADHSRVDARADVYALGVITFQLCANRLPLPMSGLTPLQALRKLTEDTPPRLSEIDARLRGDIEVIVECAMAKQPEQRYASAGAFADDLRRYLALQPIRARRPGLGYRARLFVARNRLASAAVALAALGLIVGAAIALYQRNVAIENAASAKAVSDFIVGVFTSANRWKSGRDVTARELVLRGLDEVPEKLQGFPRAQIEMYHTLGEVLARGEPTALAVEAGKRRLALLREQPDTSRTELAEATFKLAQYEIWQEDLDAGEARLADLRRAFPDVIAANASLRGRLASATTHTPYLRHRFAQHRQELTLERAQHMWRDAPYIANALYFYNNRAYGYLYEHRLSDAYTTLKGMREALLRDFAPGDVQGTSGTTSLALHAAHLARDERSDAMARRAIAWNERQFGPASYFARHAAYLRIAPLRQAGRLTEAQTLIDRIYPQYMRYPEENIVGRATLSYESALVALASGDTQRAREHMARAEIEFTLLSHADSATVRAARAGLLYLDGAPIEQLAALTEEQVRRDDGQSFRSLGWLALRALQQNHDQAAARGYLERAVAIINTRGAFLEPWLADLCVQLGVTPPPAPVYELDAVFDTLEILMAEGEARLPKSGGDALP
jgi:predicted Ser/Thr protein kinase